MPQPVIKVENLSKLYRLGEVGTGSIQHDINRWWHRMRGKEDPYAKVGQVNDRSRQSETDYVWALRDVGFEVRQGEVLGIIGRNGAGKSTLLKLLSRVTAPTSGNIKVKGRMASLLEVGTGFHPELTGRENIYLNGAIFGMRRQEISRKLDEIVDFSGCAAYMDTPVKRYSSGMYVRLAFAVAAHLDPQILIVDEVLAVGDMAFQTKCLNKMETTAKEGKTILMVSHNMASVLSLCSRAILLQDGQLASVGTPYQVLEKYQSTKGDVPSQSRLAQQGCQFLGAWIGDDPAHSRCNISMGEDVPITIAYRVEKNDGLRYVPDFQLRTEEGAFVLHANPEKIEPGESGVWHARCVIPAWFLNNLCYHLTVRIVAYGAADWHVRYDDPLALSFSVMEDIVHPARYSYSGIMPGVVRPRLDWKVARIKQS